ncbi:MAG TPA: TIGR02186 family protein [Saliniramus sp.]|nr:TIGR02186 family protein [Saliniramus sp.]
MTRRLLPILWTMALLLVPALARAEALVTSLSTHQVLITSNFTGSQVALFGAVQRDEQTIARATGYDVAIIVRGPPHERLTVREKERVGPIWVNRSQQKFGNVPRYMAVLSSRPLDEMTGEVIRERLSLGLEAFIGQPGITADRGGAEQPFREALVRLKMDEGMFFEMGRGVTFITPAIFRAGIPLNADAPPGNYEVEVLLFTDGIMLARDLTNFELVKTGVEQQLAVMAERNSALYGGLTALMALFFGWLASVIFRRD